MITLVNVRDWLAALLTGTIVQAGFIDATLDTCIGVYQRETGKWNQAIGAASTYQQFDGKLLIHWGKDVRDCETKAATVFSLLLANRKSTISTHKLVDIRLDRAPINIGRDERGVFESIVTFTIIYETE